MEASDPVKSVGNSKTLSQDVDRREDILRYLLQLSEMVGRRARRYDAAGKTVHLQVRYASFFDGFGKQVTLKSYINQSEEIYRAAVGILDSVELEQPVRLLGVSLSNLCHQQAQIPLFEADRKRAGLVRAMDEVNDRFGEFAVTYGSVLDNPEKGSRVISPAWGPSGIRSVAVE
jgi:DNA polymerase-4